MAEDIVMNAGSQAVAENLEHADKVQDIKGDVHASTEAVGGPEEHHVDPSIGGIFNGTVIVSIAMAVFIAILLVKKVPAVIGKALDGKIAAIRAQLDEAMKLRSEAEDLKAEYQAKLANAEKDAAALRARAEEEAALMVAQAKTDAAALVKRRQKMAEDKIAAAERSAVAEIRARAVSAATEAAASLIAQNHDAKADKAMIDGTIKSLGTIN
ncbi:MAG: F0F1 ATP synthase subunit B [Sphingomonadales bacterium]|nr:MAG: F0F1 ATP synthase subunit B [Sphingomonadales bacterium]TNF04815.1 MAG: F0F1 ATP synthase subunit B [Sphingomonadales bacterium]